MGTLYVFPSSARPSEGAVGDSAPETGEVQSPADLRARMRGRAEDTVRPDPKAVGKNLPEDGLHPGEDWSDRSRRTFELAHAWLARDPDLACDLEKEFSHFPCDLAEARTRNFIAVLVLDPFARTYACTFFGESWEDFRGFVRAWQEESDPFVIEIALASLAVTFGVLEAMATQLHEGTFAAYERWRADMFRTVPKFCTAALGIAARV